MNLYDNDKKYILNLYRRIPLEISHGDGSYLYAVNGDRYLDFFSGIAVNNIGFNKEIAEAVAKQAQKFIHLSNYFAAPSTVELAGLLVEHTFAEKVFFTNSGTEATEAALKVVKAFAKANGKRGILSALDSFHGRTTGALSLTGQEKYQEKFKPLIPDVRHFTYNDIEDLEDKIDETTAAVFLEMIQGEGGVRILDHSFMDKLVLLRKKYGFMIVIDEIQTCLGRTGSLFAYEPYGFAPDLVCFGKSIGGGLPLGGILLADSALTILEPGDHGTTFGGNPVACAAGLVVMKHLLRKGFFSELRGKHDYLMSELNRLQKQFSRIIAEVRGKGMMIGIECGDFAHAIKKLAMDRFVLLNVTSGTVIRLLPQLEIIKDEIDEFLTVFEDVLQQLS